MPGSPYSPVSGRGAKLKSVVDGVATIETRKGEIVLIDEADLPLLQNQSVHVANEYASFSLYDPATTRVSVHCVHREILSTVPGMHIDHINQNKLDNRRSNLRVVPVSHNVFNSKLHANNKSGLRGVSHQASYAAKPWRAQICVNYKKIYLGSFRTKEEASECFLAAEEKYFAGVRV